MRSFLSIFVLVAASSMAACQAPQNSVSQDPAVFGFQERGSAGSALAVLARNCVECHKQFGTWTEQDFRTRRTSDGRAWIVAGDLGASALYQKLRGVSAEGNMPPAGPIPREDASALAAWILGMKAFPAPEPTLSPTPVPTPSPVPTDPPAVLRWKKVQAVIGAKCVRCHDGFSEMPEREFIKEYVGAGRSESSPVLQRITSVDPAFQMPPPRSGAAPGTTLPADEIAVFREWIAGIAPDAR